MIAGCPILPDNHVLNAPVDQLPVDVASNDYVASIGTPRGLRADFGAGLWEGGPIGIPYTLVAAAQTKTTVRFDYADESDAGPYPIPSNPSIEGGAQANGDRHVLLLHRDECRLYELYAAYPDGSGWRAGSGAIFDLRTNALRPFGWTSADAAGLPILPLLVRYDEVAAGEIRHALRFTLPQIRREAVWPARHVVNNQTSRLLPPMGQRFRLKREFDISRFSRDTQVILTALKKYGMVLADVGSALYLSGVPDERWNNTVLRELLSVSAGALEAVDVSSLRVSVDSGEARDGAAAFVAVTAGSATSFDLAVDVSVAQADAGQQGQIFVAALVGNTLYFHDGTRWRPDGGSGYPAQASGALSSRRIVLLAGSDVRALSGVRVYAGYGRDAAEMLAAQRYREVYRFP